MAATLRCRFASWATSIRFPWSRRSAALPLVAASCTVHGLTSRPTVFHNVGSEILSTKGWGRRGCESGLESGAIAGCAGADRRVLGALQMRIVGNGSV